MMDRNREARRAAASMVASSNGLPRRRHRSSNSLRDSPDEDGPVELQESVRLRERVKKDRERDRDRDRERDRERDRDRERERERERSSRSSKRRRGERIMIHGSNRDDGGEDSSEESVNDDEDEDDEDNATTIAAAAANNTHNGHHNSGGVRLLPPNPASASVGVNSMSNHFHSSNSNSHHHPHHHNNTNNNNSSTNHNHQQNHNLQHRKSFPPSAAKVFRAAPVWKAGDEMIGVSVPRKARSASTKRSHDWINSSNTGGNNGGCGGGGGGAGVAGVGGGEQIQQLAPASPVRQGLITTTSTPLPVAPMSPSSSNASVRKKIKPNGPKQPRPPKSSSKASSSNPEELEIEIAEVLYGLMTQSQAPPKKEILSNDSREVNRSSSDAKSRVSSPISNSPSTANIQSSSPSILPPNSVSSPAGTLSAVAPKRKRPRQVPENPGIYSVRNSPISSTTAKLEADQTPKAETSSPNLEKNSGSTAEGGYDLGNLMNSHVLPTAVAELPLPEPMKVDSEAKLEVKAALAEELGESRDVVLPKEEVVSSPKMESPAVRAEETNREDAASVAALASATKISLTVPEVDKQRGEKFQIDLEAPPPQLRLSPERDGQICLGSASMNHKPIASDVNTEMKPMVAKDKQDEKMVKIGKENGVNVGADEKKVKSAGEDTELPKRGENKARIIDLQLDLEKPERDNGAGNKLQAVHKQQQPLGKANKEEHAEKSGQSNSLPLPMSMTSWPGGLPPMGYMTPIQGVVSMDGSTVSPAPIQPFFSQPRPKRCATHCYIARNIHYLQQIVKMNPFWPAAAAAAGSASLFGSKACNLGVVPPADLHGNVTGRGVNNAQDKGQGLAIFPGHGGKDKVSQPASIADAGQRKQQILLQQALPPVAPNNILHGPAFIFPLNHQQAAVAAASARPSSAKLPPSTGGNVTSANTSSSAAVNTSATAGGPPAAVSFNYPNMPTSETQYLAILQNNAYPFPLPAVGAPPNFRGTHPNAMPLFNGSFYSSQIIHPSQLQQQPQPQASASQSQQMPQSHQNTSISSGSSSSQKHLQSQQQRPSGTGDVSGTATGNLHNFPAPKIRPPQQSPQSQNQHITLPQGRQLENEVGTEDSPSTADSRGSRAPVNIYGQNFAMPIHAQSYALLTPPAALASASATNGTGNQSEKKQQHQQQGLKTVVDSLPPHQAFAMSFASINGATAAPGIDLSSMAQNHAILQSLPEATRQMMAANAAQVAQQRKNFRVSEDSKSGGGDSLNADDERKGLVGKSTASVGQSIAFSRSELADASGPPAVANSVIDSSRSVNLASGAARTSRPTMSNSVGAVGVSNAQLQAQHQPQQIMQFHKHQQQFVAAAAAWSKNPPTSNGSVYPEHLVSSSPGTAKFPNALSAFPQNLVQSSNSSSPTQSPQWKNSSRSTPSQVPSSFQSSSTSSLKNLPQQQGRTQPSQSQISFAANQKSSAAPAGPPPPSTNQSPASPMMVGSPSTSTISKGASGSPRTTTSASASGKAGQAALSAQQAKNSSVAGQKSSPVGGRNVPSILGSTHIAVTSISGPKPQMQHQQQQQHQQQITKNLQQAQLYFSNPYMQSQSPNSTGTNSAASAPGGGYYVQRRRPDQQQQAQPQQPPGSSASATGMLSLCPVSLAGASTSDPAKAIAAATAAANSMKGGSLASQSILHAAQFAAQSSQHQLMPTGFAYVHAVPAGVQVKPVEQKQPAGNDNLHACWQPEKK